MFSFPLPYRDELLYSVIARYGIHQGITSPKELLDDVYNNRIVAATVDLPNHIENISSLYPQRIDTSSIELIYSHTQFPLYAPFVDEKRRQNCIKFMQQQTKGSTHLTLGVAASRIQQPRWLRYCPLCLLDQKKKVGEYFWSRNWQIAGADSCLLHGALIDSYITRHPVHRHEFIAASHRTCNQNTIQVTSSTQSILITQGVCDILQLPSESSASATQWGHFYASLLYGTGLCRGQQINYEALKDKIVNFWGADWLNQYGLFPVSKESCWLKSIFRKHRKSFSYLEHMVVWYSLLEGEWQVNDVLNELRSQSVEPKVVENALLDASEKDKANYRKQWLIATKINKINYVRKHKFGSVYMWLYRHDRNWLLQINRRLQVPKVTMNHRVDWHKRDLILVKLLCKIRDMAEYHMHDQRHSMNWYLSKISYESTVGKHLNDFASM